MKRLILIAAMFTAPAFSADMVARAGKDYVRLMAAPCAGVVSEMLVPAIRDDFLTAAASMNGKEYAACWTLRPDGTVIVAYEDGDVGLIPVTDFKQEDGI